MASKQLIEAIAVTAELCGRTFSPAAARVFVMDLEGYDEQAVIGALAKCRREVKGLLTVGDVISRLDDGRPGAEQAWAMCPKSEGDTVVWTQEMATAFGICYRLIEAGDLVQARMAFLESYRGEVSKARDKKVQPEWSASLGHDQSGRQGALMEAVEHGRLTQDQASQLCPGLPEPSPEVAKLLSGTFPALGKAA